MYKKNNSLLSWLFINYIIIDIRNNIVRYLISCITRTNFTMFLAKNSQREICGVYEFGTFKMSLFDIDYLSPNASRIIYSIIAGLIIIFIITLSWNVICLYFFLFKKKKNVLIEKNLTAISFSIKLHYLFVNNLYIMITRFQPKVTIWMVFY